VRSRARVPAMSPGAERLDGLARNDKWFLSAGDGCLWAPPFPRWLDRPGFWDEGHVFHYPLAPLYSVALVDEEGASDPLRAEVTDWRPDRLRVRWRSRSGLTFTELRYVLPGGRFCSAWRTEEELGWPNPAFRPRHLVAFTALPGERVRDVRRDGRALRWATTLRDRKDQVLDVGVSLHAEIFAPRGHRGSAREDRAALAKVLDAMVTGARRSEGRADPDWDAGPFVESWAGGDLGDPTLPGLSTRGWGHLMVGLPLHDVPARHGVGFVLTVEPDTDPPDPGPAGADPSPHAPARSTEAWSSVFDDYPRFICSDPYLTRYFDYRIYGLHLNRIAGARGRIPHPAVAEGIEYFHLPITYSAQCHMWETRWSGDPSTARGSLLNFLEAQREDGSLPGRLYVNHQVGEDFYHANWADGVLAVDALHPDRSFLERAYHGLTRYAEWMARERDPEGTGMITVVNHYETGQEYMSRYLAVDARSDLTEWDPRLSLKGVDVTVYAYQLRRGLAELAGRLGDEPGVTRWKEGADLTGRALREVMWDEDAGLFSDVDGASGRRTGVKAAVCFYPLLTDLLEQEQVERMIAHLGDPSTFGTPYPVPTSAVDDPLFDPEGLWKGKRHNCPWNGRVWPMANSHVVEGLLRQWHFGRAAAGPAAADLLARFVCMMFHEGDPVRANCYEHYNPYTGHPCIFRGIDDYQHSWVLDLIVRGAAGVEPTRDALRVHPLPLGLSHATFAGRLRGHTIHALLEGDEVRIEVDGEPYRSWIGEPLEVPW
jgi:hypothetical protein